MVRTKHAVKRSRTKRCVEAVPSVTPSITTRKSTRTAPATSVQKSKQEKRYRPGTGALREIRHFQKTWDLVIPAAPFIRHVREVSHFFAPEVTRWQAEALMAIQEISLCPEAEWYSPLSTNKIATQLTPKSGRRLLLDIVPIERTYIITKYH